jgi:predicted ABC-type ATPase
MLARLRALSQARHDFAFETTLAGRTFLPWVARLRSAGYHVHLAFLSLPSPDLAVARVSERVRQGGHDVPAEVVRRRFVVGLRNFFTRYESSVDSWQLFDNSQSSGPRLIAARAPGEAQRTWDVEGWESLVEQSR